MTGRSSNDLRHPSGRLEGGATWRRKSQHWGWESVLGPMKDGAGAAVEEEDVAGGRRSLPRRRRRYDRRYGQGNDTVKKRRRYTQ